MDGELDRDFPKKKEEDFFWTTKKKLIDWDFIFLVKIKESIMDDGISDEDASSSSEDKFKEEINEDDFEEGQHFLEPQVSDGANIIVYKNLINFAKFDVLKISI